jgi:outer membrane biosynthesis protein TonB
MNDKPVLPGESPPGVVIETETHYVMVFNLLLGQGREQTKKTYKVNKKRAVIGSALSSDIRIQQNAVSNVHAVVEMDDEGHAMIYDMASETGVFVNERKTLSAELKDGDEIKIGFATLTFKRSQVQDVQSQLPPEAVRSSGARKLFYDTQEDFRPLILEDERNVIQIFDYPAANEQALQVVMYWGSAILDVKHIVDAEPVTLGEGRDSTFCVPGQNNFPLVSIEGGTVALQFAPGMEGVVRTGKQLVNIKELAGNRFHLKQTDLAKIQLKDISFFVSYSPVPPHLRRQRVLERDPLYTRIWFTSLAFTVALVLLFVGIEPKEKLETEELPPRIAQIIFKPVPPPPPPPPERKPPPPKQETKPPEPVKPPPPPKRPPPPPKKVEPKPTPTPPKPVPRRTKPLEKPTPAVNQRRGAPARAAGGDAGEGAKAKGSEGRKGRPNAPKAAVPQVRSKGNPNARTNAKSQAPRGQGNVEALFDDLNSTITQKMAASGKGASAAGERLQGYGAVTTQGEGGLGEVGSGRGGGGTSSTSEGLGEKGIGAGKFGKGVGAIGSGGNLAGTGRGRPVIEVGNATDTIIMGGLDKSVIDEYIRRHMSQIRYCYERELSAAKSGISGRVLTRFVISGSGRVSQAGVASTSLNNSGVESCLTGVLRKIVFPEPLGGGIVEVSYPFSFTPSIAGK